MVLSVLFAAVAGTTTMTSAALRSAASTSPHRPAATIWVSGWPWFPLQAVGSLIQPALEQKNGQGQPAKGRQLAQLIVTTNGVERGEEALEGWQVKALKLAQATQNSAK